MSPVLLRLTTVVIVFLVWAPVASAWSWPVKGPVLQPFSYDEAHPYSAGQHRGIDIGANTTGDPVVAPESGTVSFAGFVPTSGESVTIETADGYSVTLTHLGSIGIAKGATVAEGDDVGTVGPSGTPEQSGPYVHLGIRQTADPLGYLDPLGFLPAADPVSTPTPSPAPVPEPKPVPKPIPSPRHLLGGGGLIIKNPVAATHARAAEDEPAPAHEANPNPKPKEQPQPVRTAEPVRAEAPEIRRPLIEPFFDEAPVRGEALVRAPGAEPIALSLGPGIVAALLALVTAFTRNRRRVPLPAEVIPFRRRLPLRRAA